MAVLFTKPNFAHATLATYKNIAIFTSTSSLIIIENPIILQQQNQITFIISEMLMFSKCFNFYLRYFSQEF